MALDIAGEGAYEHPLDDGPLIPTQTLQGGDGAPSARASCSPGALVAWQGDYVCYAGRSASCAPRGTQPTDDDWGTVISSVTLDGLRFTADSLLGLEDFSHVDVIYVLDRVPEDSVAASARRPRDNPAWPLVGVLAQRNKRRPNRIGEHL